MGVPSVWVACGDLPEVDDKINENIVVQQEELRHTLSQSVEQLRQRTDGTIDCRRFERAVGGLLREILDDPTHQPLLANIVGEDGALIRHLTNCCYVCLLIGTHLSGYVRQQRRKLATRAAEDVRQLGMGAFVHDLGKVCLPSAAQQDHILNTAPDDKVYRTHTLAGYNLLRGRVSPLAAYSVIHHHQRFDGQGFPRVRSRVPHARPEGLIGPRTHIFARILTVADAFDHLLGTPEAPRPTIAALHDLLQPQFAGWFDPVVVAALNRLMPAFMLGSVVKLSDGSVAVVVENHSEAPCRPSVRVVQGDPGMPEASVSAERLDLRTCAELTVARVDGVDVRRFLFDPPPIPDGVMAYWGLRRKQIRTETLDPGALVASSEEAAPAAV